MLVLTRVRLDLTCRIGILLRGAGAALALAPTATARGSGLAGLGRKRPFGRGFKRGLHGENAGTTGKVSRGSDWRDGDRSKLATARRGEAATMSNCRCGKGRGRGKTGRRGSLPRGEAPAATRGDRGAARRRRRRVAEIRRRPACAARVCEGRAAVAA
jgi:hypothetical protein